MNAKMQISFNGIISIPLLTKLVDYARKLHYGQVFGAIFLTSFSDSYVWLLWCPRLCNSLTKPVPSGS